MSIPELTLDLGRPGRRVPVAMWERSVGEELVLFVHGYACSRRQYRGAWTSPELRDYALLAPDMPGFGRTPLPDDFDCSLAAQAALLAALIDRYASRKVHLVAHSHGGAIAAHLPERALARLSSLVLVEPRLLPASCGITAIISKLSYAEFCENFLSDFRRRNSGDGGETFDLARAVPAAMYASACALISSIAHDDLPRRVEQAPGHKFLIYGQRSAPLAECNALPAVRQMPIVDAGHFVMHDQPRLFYSAVASFIAVAGDGRE